MDKGEETRGGADEGESVELLTIADLQHLALLDPGQTYTSPSGIIIRKENSNIDNIEELVSSQEVELLSRAGGAIVEATIALGSPPSAPPSSFKWSDLSRGLPLAPTAAAAFTNGQLFSVVIPPKFASQVNLGMVTLAKNGEGLFSTSLKTAGGDGRLVGMAGLKPGSSVSSALSAVGAAMQVVSLMVGQVHMIEIRDQLAAIQRHLYTERQAKIEALFHEFQQLMERVKFVSKSEIEGRLAMINRVDNALREVETQLQAAKADLYYFQNERQGAKLQGDIAVELDARFRQVWVLNNMKLFLKSFSAYLCLLRNEKDMAQLDCLNIVNHAQVMDEDLTKISQLIREWNERDDIYTEKAKRKAFEVGRNIVAMKAELDKSAAVSKMKELTKGTKIGELLEYATKTAKPLDPSEVRPVDIEQLLKDREDGLPVYLHLAKRAQRKSGSPSSSGVVPPSPDAGPLDDGELDAVLRTMATPAKKYQLRFDTVKKSLLGRQVVTATPGVGAFEMAVPSGVSSSKL